MSNTQPAALAEAAEDEKKDVVAEAAPAAAEKPQEEAAPKKKKKKKVSFSSRHSKMTLRSMRKWSWLFIGPVFVSFIIGFLWPFGQGSFLSFCDFTIISDARLLGTIDSSNYVPSETGECTVYFRPAGNDEWSYNYIDVKPGTTEIAQAQDKSDTGSEIADGFYLVGTLNGEDCWQQESLSADRMLTQNPNLKKEFLINWTFYEGDEIKVVKVSKGAITTWYNPQPESLFKNYNRAFSDESFLHAFFFTALFAITSVILINALAFAAAYALTQGIKGSNLFRTVFFMPNLIGGIVLG